MRANAMHSALSNERRQQTTQIKRLEKALSRRIARVAEIDAEIAPEICDEAKRTTETSAQVSRLIEALRTGPKTTEQLRVQCNVYAPSQRVTDAKKKGWRIASRLVTGYDTYGRPHRLAEYTLEEESAQ